MTAPGNELQAAIVATIVADVPIMAMIGGVYDDVPERPYNGRSAYISFGPEIMDPESLECIRLAVHTVQIDVWSRAVGRVECKTICHHLIRLLDDVSLALTVNAFLRGELVLHRLLSDPKEGITHGVLQFAFEIEECI